jgi:ribosome-associated translation inhibitor RaiA
LSVALASLSARASHEDIYVAIHDAFDVAERQLAEHLDKLRATGLGVAAAR